MIYAEILVAACIGLLLGGGLGFLVGRYIWHLLDKIAWLSNRPTLPEPPKPAVTMGAYDEKPVISNTDTDKAAGIVQTKTPELLDWENREAIKKQVLGQ